MNNLTNTTTANKDLDLWKQWKKTKSPYDLQNLFNNFRATMAIVVNKWSGSIPREILETEAKKILVKAFESYDPKKGAALNTHVNNQLLQLSRFVYTYQNAARMPENLVLKLHSYDTAKNYLTDTLGREPTLDELHQELGWSKKELDRLTSYNKRDLLESGDISGDFFSTLDDADDNMLAAIYYDLSPLEKLIFQYTTGYKNSPVLSNPELCKKTNLSQAQLSYQKRLLVDKLKRLIHAYKSR